MNYSLQSLTSLLFLSALLSTSSVMAEEHGPEEHEHDGHEKNHHGHASGSFETGLSNSMVYSLYGKELAYGLHVHGIYTFEESPFGLGLGYEMIAGEHLHQTLGLVMCYRPTDPLNLCVSPGVTFEAEHGEISFSAHAEATYEFHLGGLHLGPTLGFAYNPEDLHVSLGLHTGFDF
jgi:hypothetical protein